MKSKVLKKPMFVTFKRPQENFVAFINVDDVKWAIYNKKLKKVDIATSNTSTSFDCLDPVISALNNELTQRYHMITVSAAITTEKHKDAYSAILKLVKDDSIVYVWPRGLTVIRVEDNVVHVGLHGCDDDIPVTLEEVPSASEVTGIFELLNVA